MYAFITIALIGILLSLSAFAQESKQYIFTPIELEMDAVANTYSGDNSAVLEHMEKLIAKHQSASVAEMSLLLTYDCLLRSNLASQLAQSSLDKLLALSVDHQQNYSVRAATALCQSSIAQLKKDQNDYQQSINKAFLFVQQADLATLRYWISVNINSLFTKVGDYRTAEKALLIALDVAKQNQDNFRTYVTSQHLAEIYYLTHQYDLALEHNEAAQQLFKKIGSHWYYQELLATRGHIHVVRGEYEIAKSYFQRAIKEARSKQLHREVPYFQLNLSFTLLLLDDTQAALEKIDSAQRYADDYDDQYLHNNVSLMRSFLLLREQKLEQSEITFNEAIAYFDKNGWREPSIRAWDQRYRLAKVMGNELEALKAFETFVELNQSQVIEQQLNRYNVFYEANRNVWREDDNFAHAKLKEKQQELKSSEQQVIVLYSVIGVLSFILVIGLINRILRIIRQRRAENEEINRQRFYDPLTNSFNRRYFEEHVKVEMLKTSEQGDAVFVLAFDIDHFKKVNDAFGHAIGDDVLKEVVSRLQNDVRSMDKIVRTGGEEFIIVFSAIERQRVEIVIERVLNLIAETPFIIDDTPEKITISIGYVVVPGIQSDKDINDLLVISDKALYLAKERGRNRAIGVRSIRCPLDAIDNIETAADNSLLAIEEVQGA